MLLPLFLDFCHASASIGSRRRFSMTAHRWTPTQIYATHYLFEAANRAGRMDAFWPRLETYLQLAGQGYVTTPENFGANALRMSCLGRASLVHLFLQLRACGPPVSALQACILRRKPYI
jgi:hypothetical protein